MGGILAVGHTLATAVDTLVAAAAAVDTLVAAAVEDSLVAAAAEGIGLQGGTGLASQSSQPHCRVVELGYSFFW